MNKILDPGPNVPLMGREGQSNKSDCQDAHMEVVISHLWTYHILGAIPLIGKVDRLWAPCVPNGWSWREPRVRVVKSTWETLPGRQAHEQGPLLVHLRWSGLGFIRAGEQLGPLSRKGVGPMPGPAQKGCKQAYSPGPLYFGGLKFFGPTLKNWLSMCADLSYHQKRDAPLVCAFVGDYFWIKGERVRVPPVLFFGLFHFI
jgi:hypothetical protein